MTPEKLLSEIIKLETGVRMDMWRSCNKIHKAWELSKDGKWGDGDAWAKDIAAALNVKPSTIYGRKNAQELYNQMVSEFDIWSGYYPIVDAAKKGYSYFRIAYDYRNDCALDDLLDAIMDAPTSQDLRMYLVGRYGSGSDTLSFIRKMFQKLDRWYGLLEIHRAPEDVRFAVKAAIEAIEQWSNNE